MQPTPPRVMVAIVGLLLSFSQTSAQAQPVFWPVNGHSYEVVVPPSAVDWTTANNLATSMGGHLATLTSSAENDFAFSLVSDPSLWLNQFNLQVSGPWLGGFRGSANILDWHWVTGEAFSFSSWEVNQPDNGSPGVNGEDALQFFAFGLTPEPTWNDAPHEAPVGLALLVEYEPIPEPSAVAAIAAGAAISVCRRSRRHDDN